MEFINIPQSSSTLSFLSSYASHHKMNCSRVPSEVTQVLELPPSYEEFMQNLDRKNRHELRRKLRRARSLANTRTMSWTKPQETLELISKFIQLHREASPDKEEFWRKKGMEDFFKQFGRLFSRRGWIEIETFLRGEELLSILIAFPYSRQIYFYNAAFNKKYSRYSPGIHLFHHSIQKAISKGKKEVNFLRGRESYKDEFGAEERGLFDLILTQEK